MFKNPPMMFDEDGGAEDVYEEYDVEEKPSTRPPVAAKPAHTLAAVLPPPAPYRSRLPTRQQEQPSRQQAQPHTVATMAGLRQTAATGVAFRQRANTHSEQPTQSVFRQRANTHVEQPIQYDGRPRANIQTIPQSHFRQRANTHTVQNVPSIIHQQTQRGSVRSQGRDTGSRRSSGSSNIAFEGVGLTSPGCILYAPAVVAIP